MLQAVAVLMEQVMAAQALFDLSGAAPAAARNDPLTSAGGASSQQSTSNPHTNNTTNANPSVRFNASSSTAPNTNSAATTVALAWVPKRVGPGEWLLGVSNTQLQQQPLSIRATFGRVLSVVDVPLDTKEAAAAGYVAWDWIGVWFWCSRMLKRIAPRCETGIIIPACVGLRNRHIGGSPLHLTVAVALLYGGINTVGIYRTDLLAWMWASLPQPPLLGLGFDCFG
jgi:hypothetical protein